MGTALGYAMLAAPGEALAVFVALGGGLAAPVVLATAVPGIARLLPRPGPWMLWFKQLLAFPLYATVAWLIWVLLQQITPSDGFLALLGLVLVGFAAWIYGRTRYAEQPAGRHFGLGLAATGFAASLAVAATLAPAQRPLQPVRNARTASLITASTRPGSIASSPSERRFLSSDRGMVYHLPR